MDYQNYYDKLTDLVYSGDKEIAHGEADELLIEIAMSAARQELTVEQTQSLIFIYQEVPKWYA